jgi:hypothetical protein
MLQELADSRAKHLLGEGIADRLIADIVAQVGQDFAFDGQTPSSFWEVGPGGFLDSWT